MGQKYQSIAFDLGLDRLGFILHFKRPWPLKFKGTIQRKLTGALSGINPKLMIAAGYFFLILRALSL
jgi:hypothetical protein